MAAEPGYAEFNLGEDVYTAWTKAHLLTLGEPASALLSVIKHYVPGAHGVDGPADGDPPVTEFQLWVNLSGLFSSPKATTSEIPVDRRKARDLVRVVRYLACADPSKWRVHIDKYRLSRHSVFFAMTTLPPEPLDIPLV